MEQKPNKDAKGPPIEFVDDDLGDVGYSLGMLLLVIIVGSLLIMFVGE